MLIREFGTLKLGPSGAGGVHPYHEILYIESGNSELQWMDRSYLLAAPAMVLIPAYTPHWLYPRMSGVTGWYMEADMQKEPFLNYETVLQWNRMQALDENAPLSAPLSTVISGVDCFIETYETGDLDRTAAHQLLELDIRKLLILVNEAVPRKSVVRLAPLHDKQPPDIDQHLYTILRFMERSYTHNITINELAGMCNLTPSYVIRLFKQTFGTTPMQYLQELRLNAAISYLGTTEMPIQEIAELTGFSHLHYFSRLFKQKVGHSPSAWRKKMSAPRAELPYELAQPLH